MTVESYDLVIADGRRLDGSSVWLGIRDGRYAALADNAEEGSTAARARGHRGRRAGW